MSIRVLALFTIFSGALLLGSVAIRAQSSGPLEVARETDPGLRTILERYRTDSESLERFYDAPNSESRRERYRRFYAEWREILSGLKPGTLGVQGQIDYVLLNSQLTYELRRLDLEGKRFEEMRPLVPFASEMIGMHEGLRRKERVGGREAATRLAALAADIEALEGTVRASRVPGGSGKQDGDQESERSPEIAAVGDAAVMRAVRFTGQLKNVLKGWYDFYAGYDPTFTWWVEKPYESLNKRLEKYQAFLREKVLGLGKDDQDTVTGDPVGREALVVDLAREFIPYSPEELISIAEKEFAWCEDQMRRASRQLGFGDDWAKALEHVKTLHVAPGEQPQMIRKLAEEAIQFVTERELITAPPLAVETWRMRMMSPQRQRVNPFFTGGETISVSYPTQSMTHEQKLMSMRGNNIHFARATVHHELIPGHHLQGFMTRRYRPYRRTFRTPFWGEGWALWWELLLWDLDFPQTPENKIGMLFWRTHRCARIIFSYKFHLGQMTAQECIDFLVNRVGHERENAAAEVRRSFTDRYSPLYQSAYLLGGLQLRALHREMVGSGKMSNREFHDTILRQGSMPIEMVRFALQKKRVPLDYESSWRFYDSETED